MKTSRNARKTLLMHSLLRATGWVVALLAFFNAEAYASSSSDLFMGRALAVALGVALWCTRNKKTRRKTSK